MKQIAIYGKGGIGKSTVSANISYQLSGEGFKVAQIGCDPKHDTTRLLLGGKTQTTVLDHINSDSKNADDTISVGKNGILCIETGGPEPGVGCAGRGILTAFNFMENNKVISKDTDIMLYDVLGDVVCGGFAVPLRRKYANAVFIVTSGEFMSLYAANNVLKGIRNFDFDKRRVAGLILKKLFDLTKVTEYISHKTIQREGSFFTDLLVTCGVASIKLGVVIEYWLPLLVLVLVGVAVVFAITFYFGRRLSPSYWFERSIFSWGWWTGTMAMGIALERIVDPQMKSKTMDDYALAYLPIAPVEIILITLVPIAFTAGWGGLLMWICLAFSALLILLAFTMKWWRRKKQ